MARKAKPPTARTVETLRHRREEATRKNIPTAEYQSVLEKETQDPVHVAYERRNRDLDPSTSRFFSHRRPLIRVACTSRRRGLNQTRKAAVMSRS